MFENAPQDVTPRHIDTARLRMIPATVQLLEAELLSLPEFGRLLRAQVPADWPPGESDRDAIAFFLEAQRAGGKAVIGWYGWYAVFREENVLVACAGFHGPVDLHGCAEIGFSTCEEWRGRGFAAEMVQALADWAWEHGATRLLAHTTPENAGSLAVLHRCGFRLFAEDTSEEECGSVCLERHP
jgi:RimJ/RimL family protein N-acetyltransferase